MRKLILVTAMTVALAACGTDDNANQNDLNAANASISNMAVEDPAMNADNAMVGNMDGTGNMANVGDANVQNAMEKDMKTNDPDTNLANGM